MSEYLFYICGLKRIENFFINVKNTFYETFQL